MKVSVRKGDTLWYYSQLFNVPLQLLIDSNPDTNPQQLTSGQEIAIPGYTVNSYAIKKGDTFWDLATDRKLSVETLLLVNPGVEPTHLKTGQIIKIPERVTEPVIKWKTAYDYKKFTGDIQRLLDLYPFIKKEDIGKSVMGKALPELRIGRGKKAIHFNGSFHANEWTTTPMIMRFINEYLLALTNRGTMRGLYMAPFYDQAMLSVVPMVNPDGVDLVIHGAPDEKPYHDEVMKLNKGSNDFSEWKANIRGVDLNDQFPARWYIEARRREQERAPANYPGPNPLSEPEASALAELTKQRDYSMVLAIHSQGKEFYWGFLGYEPPVSQTIASEFARVSGYEPIRYVDSYAGYKDWFIQEWRRPGFTIEIGKGKKPLALSKFGEIYQESLGIFLASFLMEI